MRLRAPLYFPSHPFPSGLEIGHLGLLSEAREAWIGWPGPPIQLPGGVVRRLTPGVPRHHGAAASSDLPHDRRVWNASPGQTHPAGMTGNSPFSSHGWKPPLPIGRDALLGPIPEEVGKLSNVGGLGLTGHHITGPIPETLNDLEKFHGLGIRHTLISGCVSEKLTLAIRDTNQWSWEVPPDMRWKAWG